MTAQILRLFEIWRFYEFFKFFFKKPRKKNPTELEFLNPIVPVGHICKFDLEQYEQRNFGVK